MAEYWRDLEIGEEIQVGDRFLDGRGWVRIEPIHLEYVRVFSEFSKPTQRQAECVPPDDFGTNRYGLDIGYFRKTINRELNGSLRNFKPSELARVLARLSKTADSSVMKEPEFLDGN